jgi:hypothetical protein
MDRFERYALIYGINVQLHKKGVGCPDGILHTAVYMLQKLLGVPLGFKFHITKNMVFSFEFKESLEEMYGQMFVDLFSRGAPKWPEIRPTERGHLFKKEYPEILSQYQSEFDWVAYKLSGKEDKEIYLLGVAVFLLHSPEKDMSYEEKITYTLELRRLAKATEDEVRLAFKEAERILEELQNV